MRKVIDCVNAFIPLLSTEYELVLGRKGVAVKLRILFGKKDCFHLMGLQYLVDRPELSRDRGKVFDEIYFYSYRMMMEISISAVRFFRKKRWIILRIRHHGLFFIRKRQI